MIVRGATHKEIKKEGLEFNYDQYSEIDAFCKKIKIDWYASAWDLKSQDFLKQFNCKYNKIASAMIVYNDLLVSVAKEKNIPLYQQVCLNIKTLITQLKFLKNIIVNLNYYIQYLLTLWKKRMLIYP